MSGSEQVAKYLKVSQRNAIMFCERVRSLSGYGPALSYQTIAKYLALQRGETPTAAKVARDIKEAIEKLPPVKNTLPIPKEQPVRSGQRRKPVRFNFIESVKMHRRSEHSLPPRPSSEWNESPQNLSDVRKRIEEAGQCPHGVPNGSICAICEPRKFREMTGID